VHLVNGSDFDGFWVFLGGFWVFFKRIFGVFEGGPLVLTGDGV
jgi:hypothetical protein